MNRFIQCLLYSLKNVDNSNSIVWGENNNGFRIVNHVLFKKLILPKIFQINNFASFVKQLNLHGFKQRVNSQNQKEYVNINFQRDNLQNVIIFRDAIYKIQRRDTRKYPHNQMNDQQTILEINRNQYKQLYEIKMKQQNMLKQLHLNYQIQQTIQQILTQFLHEINSKIKTPERIYKQKTAQLLFILIKGMEQDSLENVTKLIEDAQQINNQQNVVFSPIPFWKEQCYQ